MERNLIGGVQFFESFFNQAELVSERGVEFLHILVEFANAPFEILQNLVCLEINIDGRWAYLDCFKHFLALFFEGFRIEKTSSGNRFNNFGHVFAHKALRLDSLLDSFVRLESDFLQNFHSFGHIFYSFLEGEDELRLRSFYVV